MMLIVKLITQLFYGATVFVLFFSSFLPDLKVLKV